MANDDFFAKFVSSEIEKSNCEIGFHLHAWNTPPDYELARDKISYGQPYLIEYPLPVMKQKMETLHNLLKTRFNVDIISHRSGRWAMNQDYFDLLVEFGLKIDCSVTPHVSWVNSKGLSDGSKGTDYTKYPENPYIVTHSRPISCKSILEVPVTIRNLHILPQNSIHIQAFLSEIKRFIRGKTIWLRPNGNNLSDMLKLVDFIHKSNADYLMFMLHSSELMPGGSPIFKTHESIEDLYKDLEILFKKISENFKGITLKSYYESIDQFTGSSL
jgi:hypothetical protein